MANDLTGNVSQMVLKKFIPGFMDDRVLMNTVNTEIIKGVIDPNTGDSVRVKRPMQYRSYRTADGNMTGKTASALNSATAEAKIGEFITVWVNWAQLEEAIQLNQMDEILKPARDEMITALENDVATRMMSSAALISGDPTQFISKWKDVAGTGSYFTALGTKDPVTAALNPWSAQDLAETQSGLASGDNNLVTTAWKETQISKNFGGVRGLMCNSLTSVTLGTCADTTLTVDTTPVATYDDLKNTYQMTVTLTGGTTDGTITKGTVLQFPATKMINQQNKNPLSERGSSVAFTGTVTADVTLDGSGDGSVVISGAAIVDADNPQFDTVEGAITAADSVKIMGTPGTTVQPGLAYTKGFFGIGTVQLPKLKGWDSSVINVDGISIRATLSSDPITGVQAMRLDLLPSFAVLNPMFGMQVFGNA